MTENYKELRFERIPDQSVLLAALKSSLPKIEWRPGDSDAQGKYIKGYDSSNAGIAFWLGEDPAYLVLNYRRVAPEHRADVDALEQTLRSTLADLGISITAEESQ